MNFNIAQYSGVVERTVGCVEREGKPVRSVILARDFNTTINELWDALTNIERIPSWFSTVSGELKLGGRYQIEGNAGGRITECEELNAFSMTWEMHDDVSWLELRLREIGEAGQNAVQLTLTHTSLLSNFWTEYGPGATGVGWEFGLLGLAQHLESPDAAKMDEEQFSLSPEGKTFTTQSSEAWGEASIAAGTDTNEAQQAVKRTTAFYTGEAVETF